MSQAMISGGKVAIGSLAASKGPTAENSDIRVAIRRSDAVSGAASSTGLIVDCDLDMSIAVPCVEAPFRYRRMVRTHKTHECHRRNLCLLDPVRKPTVTAKMGQIEKAFRVGS